MTLLKKSWIISVIILAMILTACSNKEKTTNTKEEAKSDAATEVRIGYFPNLTHLSTIVSLEKGYLKEALGNNIEISTKTFPDGGSFMEAMSTNAIDLGTVGPTPAINNYVKNPQHEIIAGAVNAGAVLVVRGDANIQSIADLDGKTVAIPTIGSTQDIMLMKALKDAKLSVKTSGGTVNTVKQAPADTAALFLQKQVDAAATQEPWGVNLEKNAGAKLLLGAEEFAWGKESTNTVVVAQKAFTKANPDLTEKILKAHIKAIEFIKSNPEEAAELFIKHIKEKTGKELAKDEVALALQRCIPTYDVNEDVLKEMASISKDAGYITTDKIDGLVNLSYLEKASK